MSEDFKLMAEDIADFCNAVESACVKLRVQIEKLLGPKAKAKATLPEDMFHILKWQDEKGSRLGCYQVADKKHNILDKWQHCFNILRQNNSLIADPFLEEGYQYRYWIYEKYPDRIFRKKLNEKEV